MAENFDGVQFARFVATKFTHITHSEIPFSASARFEQPKTTHLSGISLFSQ